MSAVEFYGYEKPETQESWLGPIVVGLALISVVCLAVSTVIYFSRGTL